MKTKILSALAIGALAISAAAQNYKVVVTTTDGEKYEYPTSGVESINFEDVPYYAEANYLIGAQYGIKDDMGVYSFTIATEEPDEWGDPADVGGVQLSLELTSNLSEDFLDAQLPTGYYRAGSGAEKWQINIQTSGMWMRVDEGEDGVITCAFINGTVDVRRNGEDYDIRIELLLIDGSEVALSYNGPIKFRPGASTSEEFKEDQDITFTGAQERYYANWFYPFADDANLELYTGSFNNEGMQIEGYWLNLPIYMPKVDDPKHPDQYVADGVYNIETREATPYYTNLPYTFEKGGLLDFWGVLYPIGTYITYLEKSGRMMRAFITDGTVIVSNKGRKIELDLVAENGIKIKGVYEGNIVLDDRCNNDDALPIEGTIDKDVEFDFIDATVGLSYPLGDYIKSGVYQYWVMITDPSEDPHGDFLMLELSSDDSTILPDGTYTINNEIAPFCGLKGFLDYGGTPEFSWYGNLDDVDEFGVQNIVAPIMGGTVTITTINEYTRKLVFDLVDEDGHKLTGTYEGFFENIPQSTKTPLKTSPKAAPALPEKAPLQPMRIK